MMKVWEKVKGNKWLLAAAGVIVVLALLSAFGVLPEYVPTGEEFGGDQ